MKDLMIGDELNLDYSLIENADLEGLSMDNLLIRYSIIWHTNMKNASLPGADLFFSSIGFSDLYGVNLEGGNLDEAKFTSVNLCNANLLNASILRTSFAGSILDGCKISFHEYTSIKDILSLRLGNLPENLNNEIMKRGSFGNHWGPDKPEIDNNDLMLEICRFKGWGIDGKLTSNN